MKFSALYSKQGSYGHGKPGKVMDYLMAISRPRKVIGKNKMPTFLEK